MRRAAWRFTTILLLYYSTMLLYYYTTIHLLLLYFYAMRNLRPAYEARSLALRAAKAREEAITVGGADEIAAVARRQVV